jgi:ubiquinone/menaquinone biosynthesis C-methylase UbiE
MKFNFVKNIRNAEIDLVLSRIQKIKPEGAHILEIGAGGGWQAMRLSQAKYNVKAIDIDSSRYRSDRCFDVIEFNGEDIPFSDNSFDIIFSSNVLEHVQNPVKLSIEIRRCLKPDGLQIHLVPSGSWRFFTSFIHYPFILKFIFQKIFRQVKGLNEIETTPLKSWKWYHKLVSKKHGETGNVFTETFWFSRWGWASQFRKWNLPLDRTGSNEIFYTGYLLFGSLIPLTVRHLISKFLGSSGHIYQGGK